MAKALQKYFLDEAECYDFLFNGERLCSAEEFINDSDLATLEFDKDFEV